MYCSKQILAFLENTPPRDQLPSWRTWIVLLPLTLRDDSIVDDCDLRTVSNGEFIVTTARSCIHREISEVTAGVPQVPMTEFSSSRSGFSFARQFEKEAERCDFDI